MKTAVWAFDIVKYCLGDIYLLLVGDGPESARVERFVKAVAFDDNRVRFAGSSIDRHDAVHLADQVWIIGRNEVGFALSAMAAGKPILGMYDEDIAEIVSDSGRLVGSRDRVALAAASLDLLNDRASADRLGEAGRDRVEREFSHESRARSLAALYDSMSFSTDRINA